MRIPSWDEWKELGQIFREIPDSFRAEVIEPVKRDIREEFFGNYDHRYLKAGDVIGAPYTQKDSMIPFLHYGIYIGNEKVIHFASKDGRAPQSINKISLASFASEQTRTFFLIDFDQYFKDANIYKMSPALAIMAKNMRRINNYKDISAKETVRRAKSKLGETGYSLLFNNCEHFAMWCKTGIAEFNQWNMTHELNQYRVYFSFSLRNYK